MSRAGVANSFNRRECEGAIRQCRFLSGVFQGGDFDRFSLWMKSRYPRYAWTIGDGRLHWRYYGLNGKIYEGLIEEGQERHFTLYGCLLQPSMLYTATLQFFAEMLPKDRSVSCTVQVLQDRYVFHVSTGGQAVLLFPGDPVTALENSSLPGVVQIFRGEG